MRAFDAQKSIATIPADAVRRVLPFASTYRASIAGVHVIPCELESGGALVMATDGAVLVCTRAKSAKVPKPITLPFTSKVNKGGLRSADTVEVSQDGTVWTRIGKDGVSYICPDSLIDAPFPKLDALVGDLSDWTPGLHGTFDTKLLVGRVLPQGPITFYRNTAGDKTLFVLDSATFGILMPMRASPPALAEVVPAAFRKAVAA